MSGLPPKADIHRTGCDVSFVPKRTCCEARSKIKNPGFVCRGIWHFKCRGVDSLNTHQKSKQEPQLRRATLAATRPRRLTPSEMIAEGFINRGGSSAPRAYSSGYEIRNLAWARTMRLYLSTKFTHLTHPDFGSLRPMRIVSKRVRSHSISIKSSYVCGLRSTYKDEKLPDAPAELVDELSRRYIQMYEQITGEKFVCGEKPIGQRILQTFCVCFAIQTIIAPWARRAC